MQTHTNAAPFPHIDLKTLKFAVECYFIGKSELLETIYQHFLTTHQYGPMLALLHILKLKEKTSTSDNFFKKITQNPSIISEMLQEFNSIYQDIFNTIRPYLYTRSDMHLHAMLGDIGEDGSDHSFENLTKDQSRDGIQDQNRVMLGLTPAQYLALFHPQLIPDTISIIADTGYASRNAVCNTDSGLGENGNPHFFIEWMDNIQSDNDDKLPTTSQLLNYRRKQQNETNFENLLHEFLLKTSTYHPCNSPCSKEIINKTIFLLISTCLLTTNHDFLYKSNTSLIKCIANAMSLLDIDMEGDTRLANVRTGQLLHVMQFPSDYKINIDVKSFLVNIIQSYPQLKNESTVNSKISTSRVRLEKHMQEYSHSQINKLTSKDFYNALIDSFIPAAANNITIDLTDELMHEVLLGSTQLLNDLSSHQTAYRNFIMNKCVIGNKTISNIVKFAIVNKLHDSIETIALDDNMLKNPTGNDLEGWGTLTTLTSSQMNILKKHWESTQTSPDIDLHPSNVVHLDHFTLCYAQDLVRKKNTKLTHENHTQLLQALIDSLIQQDHTIEEVINKILPLMHEEANIANEKIIFNMYLDRFKQSDHLSIKALESCFQYINTNSIRTGYEFKKLLTQLLNVLHNLPLTTDLRTFNNLLLTVLNTTLAYQSDEQSIPTELNFLHTLLKNAHAATQQPIPGTWKSWLQIVPEQHTRTELLNEINKIAHPDVKELFITTYKTNQDNPSDDMFSLINAADLDELSQLLANCVSDNDLDNFKMILKNAMQYNLEEPTIVSQSHYVLHTYIKYDDLNIPDTWSSWIHVDSTNDETNYIKTQFSSIRNIFVIHKLATILHLNAIDVYQSLNSPDQRITYASALNKPFMERSDYAQWLYSILHNGLTEEKKAYLIRKFSIIKNHEWRSQPLSLLSCKFIDYALAYNGYKANDAESYMRIYERQQSTTASPHAFISTNEPKDRIATQLTIILLFNNIKAKSTDNLDLDIIDNISMLVDHKYAKDYIKTLFQHYPDIVFNTICTARTPSTDPDTANVIHDKCKSILPRAMDQDLNLLIRFPDTFFTSKQKNSLLLPDKEQTAEMLNKIISAPHLKISKEFIQMQKIGIVMRFRLYAKLHLQCVNQDANFIVRNAQIIYAYITASFKTLMHQQKIIQPVSVPSTPSTSLTTDTANTQEGALQPTYSKQPPMTLSHT